MNNKWKKSRLLACFVSLFLLAVLAGCSKNETLLPGIDLPDKEPNPVTKPVTPEEKTLQKMYNDFSEAYLDILTGNHSILTNEKLSDSKKEMGLDLGDGKIAVLDVLGDETPELLYIYTDTDISNYLKVFTYSKTDEAKSVFDSCIYTAAGGEGYYCVYLTHDKELMGYFSHNGAYSYYGFWSLIPALGDEYNAHEESYFSPDNCSLAKLYYGISHDTDEIEETYMQDGQEITENQFDKAGKEIVGDISQVLFQGVVYPQIGLGLYKYNNFWNDVVPFEESCMTYDEAISMLAGQRASID